MTALDRLFDEIWARLEHQYQQGMPLLDMLGPVPFEKIQVRIERSGAHMQGFSERASEPFWDQAYPGLFSQPRQGAA
jgi:hypothetical protein